MDDISARTDEELVVLYVKGDDEAFDLLLKRYKDKIYTYIFYAVHNPDVADDLFQEVFIKVILTLRQGRYKESGKFGGWLMRITHNVIIDQFRSEKNENIFSSDATESDLFHSTAMADQSKEAELVNEQVLCDVKMLMEQLPEAQREVVHMRFYQELSFKEISETTGVSINTALGRMRYAIMNMRRMAKEQGISLSLAI